MPFFKITSMTAGITALLLSATAFSIDINDMLIPYVGPTHTTAGTITFTNNNVSQSVTVTTFAYDFYQSTTTGCNDLGTATLLGESRNAQGSGSINIPVSSSKTYSVNNMSVYNVFTANQGGNPDNATCLRGRSVTPTAVSTAPLAVSCSSQNGCEGVDSGIITYN